MFITLFKRIEFWITPYAWRHPSYWTFGIYDHCENGCILVDIGFVGFTWLRGECVTMAKWFDINDEPL
jgi:hypothetical protein